MVPEYTGCKRCGEVTGVRAGEVTLNGKKFSYSGCRVCYKSHEEIELALRVKYESP